MISFMRGPSLARRSAAEGIPDAGTATSNLRGPVNAASSRPVRVATVGASSSANKGAASMLQAVIDRLPERVGPCEFSVLSTYPDDDRREPPRARPDASVRIVPSTPGLLLVMFPLALLAWVLGRLHLPRRLACRTEGLRALLAADVVVDVSGISFVDSRGLATLGYNVLVTGVPLLLGKPVVKCAQALGPFDNPLNRAAAKRVLRRCAVVCPRGDRTEAHVSALGVAGRTRVMPAADTAFLMDLPDADRQRADELLAELAVPMGPDGEQTELVGVMPSSVVERYCEREGIDYIGLVARLIDETITQTGTHVLLVAHSARPEGKAGRMNDIPTCRRVHAAVRHREKCTLVDRSLPPTVLRALIDRCEVLATSRFHAMISALATTTPVLVVGWSHKYAEVLRELGLEEWVVDFAAADGASLAARVAELRRTAPDVRRQIVKGLPAVIERAERNLDAIEIGLGRAPSSELHGASGTRSPGNRATVRDSLQGVIDNDMCIGCGACTFADPTVAVSLHPEKLIYAPETAGNATAAAVCPAVQVDFAGLHEKVFPGLEVGDYGVVDSVLLAQSTNEPRNMNASSGGLIKELLHHLLERPDVDGIIALGHVEGLDFQPRLITEPEGIDQLPGSIYHNLSQPRAIELLRENEGRFVLVAIPCQLEGIYQYIHECEPHLAARIHTTVGLLCGWQYSHHAIKAICEYLGADYEQIVDIAYRGGGPVGKLRIRTRDGREVSASRRVDFGYQVAFDRHFNTPRCHTCINHSNFLADIVVGDAWLPSTVFTKTGISLLICRKPDTRTMVDELIAAGRVVASEVTTEEIRESQTDRVIFGNFAYAYSDYLDELGLHHPDMVGPNRDRAKLAPRDEVVHFHKELVRKLELQREGRYRFLKWRKATYELPRFLNRYWTWFTVRILKIKSIKGERREVPKEKLSIFR
jgi:coenzyme F420-reducing hydrogenase beta subunit/polysaccharide pyruvyl transferase WcaK-like protein